MKQSPDSNSRCLNEAAELHQKNGAPPCSKNCLGQGIDEQNDLVSKAIETSCVNNLDQQTHFKRRSSSVTHERFCGVQCQIDLLLEGFGGRDLK